MNLSWCYVPQRWKPDQGCTVLKPLKMWLVLSGRVPAVLGYHSLAPTGRLQECDVCWLGGSLEHLVGGDVEQHGASPVSEHRQGPELLAWGRGQWVTPSPPPVAEHISAVPVSRRAPRWHWRGLRARAGGECLSVLAPLPLMSGFQALGLQAPGPFCSWAVLARRRVASHGCRKQHLRITFLPPRGPAPHSPRPGKWGRKAGCACVHALPGGKLISWGQALRSLRQPLPV